MRMPKTPPDFSQIWNQMKLYDNPDKLERLIQIQSSLSQSVKYLHWDKLRHLTPPESMTHEEWWLAIKMKRQSLYKQIPLHDKNGKPFVMLTEVDPILERLHDIDLGAGGLIQMPDQITNPDTKDQYYISSLIQEAITSSQLEGAATTRPDAKEMIKSGRKPTDRSEQMILNNYHTMQFINTLKDTDLSKSLVFEIHRRVTHDTLDDSTAAGRFRKPDESVSVVDQYNEVMHTPPPADSLDKRLDLLCKFANRQLKTGYIHPAVRSIILHFWLAYDHPFIDGNGRTARALFYWSMLRHKYWLFEFVSISQIILNAPAKYERAFLYTETDENDLTYFILYHLDVIHKAVEKLHEYIQQKTQRLQSLERDIKGLAGLNHRQRMLISHALRHQFYKYTFKSHQTSHGIVYQTARLDLMDLENKGLLTSRKVGRTWYFTPAKNLEEKLAKLA
ncbi:MAG: Fic family protein [Phycisphaerae bacterium]|nr:Fic family protein [Phycisphaerae bacterium]